MIISYKRQELRADKIPFTKIDVTSAKCKKRKTQVILLVRILM